MLVIVGTTRTRTDAHSLRRQVGIGSESNCLLEQLDKILRISESEAGVKEETSGGVKGEEGECGDDVVGLLERQRRGLDICLNSLSDYVVSAETIKHLNGA